MVGKKQGSAQHCSPAGKGYSAFPFPLPHIPPCPSSLTTLCWSTQALCCLCFPGTWHCLFGMPWPPPQMLAVRREVCLISVTTHLPSGRCLLCRAAHQKHPGTFHRLMPLLAGKGRALCSLGGGCSPCPPLQSPWDSASHGDEEMNVPRHQGGLVVTNAGCNLQK